MSETKADDFVEKLITKGKTTGIIPTTDDFIFGSARQFVRNKYGQSVLNQFIAKFGVSNEGAAAVIVQKWGDEGLVILSKTTVNNFDDITSELLKNKIAYRHIGSNVSYLEQLKSSGIIPEQIGQGQTYFSLDKNR